MLFRPQYIVRRMYGVQEAASSILVTPTKKRAVFWQSFFWSAFKSREYGFWTPQARGRLNGGVLGFGAFTEFGGNLLAKTVLPPLAISGYCLRALPRFISKSYPSNSRACLKPRPSAASSVSLAPTKNRWFHQRFFLSDKTTCCAGGGWSYEKRL